MEQESVPADLAQPGRLGDESELQAALSRVVDEPALEPSPLEPRFEIETHLERVIVRIAALMSLSRLMPSPLFHRENVMADDDRCCGLGHKGAKESSLSFSKIPDRNGSELAAGPPGPHAIEHGCETPVARFESWRVGEETGLLGDHFFLAAMSV
jgi:hypothetical protein